MPYKRRRALQKTKNAPQDKPAEHSTKQEFKIIL